MVLNQVNRERERAFVESADYLINRFRFNIIIHNNQIEIATVMKSSLRPAAENKHKGNLWMG